MPIDFQPAYFIEHSHFKGTTHPRPSCCQAPFGLPSNMTSNHCIGGLFNTLSLTGQSLLMNGIQEMMMFSNSGARDVTNMTILSRMKILYESSPLPSTTISLKQHRLSNLPKNLTVLRFSPLPSINWLSLKAIKTGIHITIQHLLNTSNLGSGLRGGTFSVGRTFSECSKGPRNYVFYHDSMRWSFLRVRTNATTRRNAVHT